ncbi:hypothetical protein L3Y34_019469 [Caenorhabditis briggsae]|uniref:Uncharacterized protein n=1 Tax=Caenorhabditis briggsae TaxID=6238 RepID=A0AAE9DNR4_CAEBR|nr:hypothetical protein L3Y34_019469 [Caenorhabditis briggsae]
MNRYIFHYGNDQFYNPLIIFVLTALCGRMVRMPAFIIGHFYYNIIISFCYIDLSCVVRGYMNYSFHYEEELRTKQLHV